ncbi:MAG: SRPBCC family protein [Devosia sp.]
MPATRLHLVSDWHLKAPLERVWAELSHPDDWPAWWRAVKRVEMVAPGDGTGIGAVRNFTWGTALPYQLHFEMTATRVEPMTLLEGRARGELDGTGLWTLEPEAEGTHVRYEWNIDVTVPWQVALAPLLRPVFAWNHNVVMGWGEADLKTRLAQTR